MTRPNSCKPFVRVRSIRKRFEKACENQQFKRQLSFIGSDIVRNIRLQYEEQISRKNRDSNVRDINNYSNGDKRASSRAYTSNSFEKDSRFNKHLISDTSCAGENAHDGYNNEDGNVIANDYNREINNVNSNLISSNFMSLRQNEDAYPSNDDISEHANIYRDDNKRIKSDRSNSFSPNLKSTTASSREYTSNTLPRTIFSPENTTINSEPFAYICSGYNSDYADNEKSENVSVHEDDCIQQNDDKKESVVSSDLRSSDDLFQESKRNIPKTMPNPSSNEKSENINITKNPIDKKKSNLCRSKFKSIDQSFSHRIGTPSLKENREHKVKSESQQLIYTHFNSDENVYFTINNSLKQEIDNALHNLPEHSILDVDKEDYYTIGNIFEPAMLDLDKDPYNTIDNVASSFNNKEAIHNLSEHGISDVDKTAYYTIDNVLLSTKGEMALHNLFKHAILDFATQYGEYLDSEHDIFGAHSNIGVDFCVETFNNGNENVLFKIWIDTDSLNLGNERILHNQSKHAILDFAKQYEESFDSADDIYGTHSNVGTDFCVETFNNSNENVLFKIWIDRDRLTEIDEFNTVIENNVFYEDEYECQTRNEKLQYHSINNINEAEPEFRSTENIWKDSNIPTTKSNEEDHELQSDDCTDGSSPWRNSNYFSSSVDQYNVIKELIDTEETYLKNMLYVIVNYLHHFRRDSNISPDIEMVFGNIEQIYRETKRILASLKNCKSAEEIANVFLTSVHIFELYIEYMRNKSKSYQYATKAFSKLLKSRQIELNDSHSCENYLVNPVQRLARYGLLLRKLSEVLLKATETCTAVEEAISLIETKTFEGNTIMAIDSIRYCPINLKRLKRYLMKDTFYINRKCHNALFLFEEGVVFCKEDQDNIDQYEFLECLEMNKLVLKHLNKSKNFRLGYFNKSKKYGDENDYEFDIEARSISVKEDWVNEIRRLLWGQYESAKENLNATLNRKDCHGERNYCAKNRVDVCGNYKNFNNTNGKFIDNDKSTRIEITSYFQELDDDEVCEGAPLSEEYNECGEMNNKFGIEYDETSSIKDESPKTDIMHKFSEAKSFYIYNISEGQSNAIKEILTSEENYLTEMQDIMENNGVNIEDGSFCPYIYILIENIKSIYQQNIRIYSQLLECNTIDAFARIYLDNESIFDLYINFMFNKSTFCRYTIHQRIELNSHQTFDDYLVKAVVRLSRYKNQLEALDGELRKTGDLCPTLKEVITLLYDKMITLNRILVINSIQRCPINLEKMGSFIMNEAFQNKSSDEVMIFLFERIIILTREDSNTSDTYIYIDSIELSVLSISSSGAKGLKLRSKDKLETFKKKYEIEAKSEEKREIWKNRIEKLLKRL